MPIQENQIRNIIAIILSLFIALFGVYLFSDFVFLGNTLQSYISPRLTEGTPSEFFKGIYFLIRSAFQANWFSELSASGRGGQTVGQVLFSEPIWPSFLTWFSVGLVGGIIIRGVKRSLILAAVIDISLIFLLIITGLFGGEDLHQVFIVGIGNTLAIFLTVFIFSLLGASLGGFLSGPDELD